MFPESPIPEWLPPLPGATLFQEMFLAAEEGIVRGGYILKHQEFMLNKQRRLVDFYHSPLSEGLIDRKYSAVGLKLLQDALKRNPPLYALGMGGRDKPLPRML